MLEVSAALDDIAVLTNKPVVWEGKKHLPGTMEGERRVGTYMLGSWRIALANDAAAEHRRQQKGRGRIDDRGQDNGKEKEEGRGEAAGAHQERQGGRG